MGAMATSSCMAPSGHTDAQKTRPKNREKSSGMTKNESTATDTPTSGMKTAAITFCVEPTGQMQPVR
jgi:hypothetical protein